MKIVSKNCIRRSLVRSGLLLVPLVLVCFGFSPEVQATCQEGCLTHNNTVLGDDGLISNMTGSADTAIGFNALLSNTTGSFNTAVGNGVLSNNTAGDANTAVGNTALGLNTTGRDNTAIGSSVLETNFTGNYNTAIGSAALLSNVSGGSNTANGFAALQANEDGNENTAIGYFALSSNTSGDQNTANGVNALFSNVGGVGNTATGHGALYSNFANFNTACGIGALLDNTSGANNIALGANAGRNLTTGSNNIVIGNAGNAGASNSIHIGSRGTHTATFIAGISGVAVTGSQVIVHSNGKLGVTASSERFKDDIRPMNKASEAILALQPVTFRYKHELDPAGVPQFGLVAEQVEKVNPNLIARDADGKAYTVRYEAVNAMLLNEFLKEHREVQELKKQVTALSAGLQKVSAQLELSKSEPQTVLNKQ